jgi:hypothetical protein
VRILLRGGVALLNAAPASPARDESQQIAIILDARKHRALAHTPVRKTVVFENITRDFSKFLLSST